MQWNTYDFTMEIIGANVHHVCYKVAEFNSFLIILFAVYYYS